MIGRRLFRWRCSVRLPWRLARRRAALLAGAPASQRMQDESSGGFAGAPCPSRSASVTLAAWAPSRSVFSALMAGSGRPTIAPWCRPACAVAARLAAVLPSVCVVALLLGVGWRCGSSRARWPSGRRRSGRLGRWPRSFVRPRCGFTPLSRVLPARPRLASGRLRWRFRGVWLCVGSSGASSRPRPRCFSPP